MWTVYAKNSQICFNNKGFEPFDIHNIGTISTVAREGRQDHFFTESTKFRFIMSITNNIHFFPFYAFDGKAILKSPSCNMDRYCIHYKYSSPAFSYLFLGILGIAYFFRTD